MAVMFPGTTIETSSLERGSSRQLFDGIFATGGITLSQISVMTGLEPYFIQNWVKRGFVSPPVKRMYSREQFARILLLNMLRESLQLEQICGLLGASQPAERKATVNGIEDSELYHRYVDLLSEDGLQIADEASVRRAAESAAADWKEDDLFVRKRLIRILQIMWYAHTSARLRRSAEDALAALR